MNQPPLDRADFLRTLRRCHTEEQLFSRLTFACLAQYDEAQRPELLDDVRGAAYSLRLPAVEYKTDQWLHRCQDAIDTDRDAFLAAANAEARRENDKMRAEQTPVGPGVLADVPLQNVDWLVPDLLPRGELSLLGADGGTGKGLWQAQLIACVTTGKTSGFFPVPPAQTGKVLILAGEDDPGKVLKARLLAAGADMNRVLCLTADDYFRRTGQPLTLKDEALAKFAAKAGPLLLIVDPLQSFLPAGVEMASRNQMRSILLPLKAIAAARQCAVLLVMHSNKKQGVSDRKRLADSSDIWDMARSVLMMGRSNSDGKIYLSHEKSSYSRPQQTVLLHIEDVELDGVRTAQAVFDGYTDKKDADFIKEPRVRQAQTKEDTRDAILNVLAESRLGSMASSELRAAVVKEIGCSDRTYERAYASPRAVWRCQKTYHPAKRRQKQMVFLLQWNKWRSSKIIIYLRLNFNVRQLGGVAPAGGVPTSPGPLDSAMLAKLLFQRCFVQKAKLCQITRLSQRMAQKKTTCVRYAGGPSRFRFTFYPAVPAPCAAP